MHPARNAIANFLLWFNSARYETPEEAADALLKRLALEGYLVVSDQEEIEQ